MKIFRKRKILDNKMDNLIELLEKSNLEDISDLFSSKKELIKRNFIAGVFRGIGVGIGVTVITAILVLILRKIVALNIPVIGEYIADLVDIVERSR